MREHDYQQFCHDISWVLQQLGTDSNVPPFFRIALSDIFWVLY